MERNLESEICASLRDGKLPCAVAWQVAERMGVTRIAVGETVDKLDVRISHCQLGLFGFGDKRLGEHKIMSPADDVTPALAEAIGAVAQDGKITCAQLFEVAQRVERPPMAASAQAEALDLKIVNCQLGCFP